MSDTKYDRAQEALDISDDALRVLRWLFLYRHQVEIQWSVDALTQRARLTVGRTLSAVKWLKKRALITYIGGIVRRTTEGDEAYTSHCVAGMYSDNEFKSEALSGMVQSNPPAKLHPNWQRSKLTWVALPAPMQCGVTPGDPIKSMQRRMEMQLVARGLDMSLEEFRDNVESGIVKICDGRDWMEPHYGIFRSKKRLCEKCRATRKPRRK